MGEPTRRGGDGGEAIVPDDPFAVLGLPLRQDLTDEDVRAAWRRIAAATHPDLPDGGDPARYSAAAAAYDTLRTPFGRGEALADLRLERGRRISRAPRHGMHRRGGRGQAPSWAAVPRVIGDPALGAGIVTAAVLAVAVAGWTPASIGLGAGAVTWLLTGWGRWRRGGWGP